MKEEVAVETNEVCVKGRANR